MNFKKEALGTILEIKTNNSIEENDIEQINFIIESFEEKYSRFINDNFLDKLNKSGSSNIDEEFKALFSLCETIYKISYGFFDITILPILENLGYGIKKNIMKNKVGFENIKIKENIIYLNGTNIEFGAIGKGYLIDKIYDFLKYKYTDIVINFGGDIKVGKNEKIVGLEDPYDNKKIIGNINIKNSAFCSSSGIKRTFSNSHHLINPKNYNSQNDKISVYVTHNYASFADAFATALFVTPIKQSLNILEKIEGLEGLIILKNGEIYKSLGFNIDLF